MASKDGIDYSKKIMIQIPQYEMDGKELLEFGHKYCRALLAIYGEETKILTNKRELKEILNNLSNYFNSDKPYNGENFYLAKLPDNNTKIYVESLDERTRKLKQFGETKILMNKKVLEEILKNIPENCPICKLNFDKKDFYLVDIASGCSAETYIECTCENYRDVLVDIR